MSEDLKAELARLKAENEELKRPKEISTHGRKNGLDDFLRDVMIRNNKAPLDIISTDHAPHLAEEKAASYFKAPSGTPMVQHSLLAVLQLVKDGKMELVTLVDKMCHAPAICYNIEKRGFIRPGYFADLVLVDPDHNYTVGKENILSKCRWSVFEGTTFNSRVEKTFVNGNLVYDKGKINDNVKGLRLTFDRK